MGASASGSDKAETLLGAKGSACVSNSWIGVLVGEVPDC